MIRPFKFFHGITGARVVSIGGVLNELNEPYIPLQITHAPPFGMSHRHWNMMPQDLRGGDPRHMGIYIEGWEAARDANYNNPYPDQLREVWNRGFDAWWSRRNVPPIDERYPEYYNTDEYVFFDVTEVIPDLDNNRPYKFMLFRHIEDGNTVEGQRIYPGHPMYNFPDVI